MFDFPQDLIMYIYDHSRIEGDFIIKNYRYYFQDTHTQTEMLLSYPLALFNDLTTSFQRK